MISPKCLVVLAAGLLSASAWAQTRPATRESELPSATIEQRKVEIHPSGATFEIPENWFSGADRRIRLTSHLTRTELDAVKDGAGEWDTQYGQLVNAVLPFESCAAHIGTEGWGLKGGSYGDLQFRVYVVKAPLAEMEKRIAGVGLEEAKRIAARWSQGRVNGPEATATPATADRRWSRMSLNMPLWFGDYGAIATVDFYSGEFEGQTVVMTFMHSDLPMTPKGTEEIVESFRWPKSGP